MIFSCQRPVLPRSVVLNKSKFHNFEEVLLPYLLCSSFCRFLKLGRKDFQQEIFQNIKKIEMTIAISYFATIRYDRNCWLLNLLKFFVLWIHLCNFPTTYPFSNAIQASPVRIATEYWKSWLVAKLNLLGLDVNRPKHELPATFR